MNKLILNFKSKDSKRIKDSKSPVVRPRGRYKLELIGRVGVQE